MINIGIGVGWAKAIYSVANNVIANFRARVLSYPNSIFEAGPCLDATLEELNAIGLLDNASLIVTPNAYNEGILYDVIPNTTLGDMTVVRATTATRVNSAGLIEVVPRNLLTYSEQFENSAWTKINSTISANATIAPNGTLTASKIIASAVSGDKIIYQIFTTSIGIAYTVSAYYKSSEYTQAFIRFGGTLNSPYVIYDLTTQTIVSTSALISSSITLIGNGWYKITATAVTSSTNIVQNIMMLPSTGYTLGTNNVPQFTGNNTSGGFIWGSQCEVGSTATEYFPTTTRLNIPRIDYSNGSCPSLLVEPQRTNLATYSEQFDNADWTKVRASVTANTTISPDGTQNADTFGSSAGQTIFPALTRNPTFTGNASYSLSIFAKVLGNTNVFKLAYVDNVIGFTGGSALFNLATQAITITQSPNSSVTAKIQNYGNGWYRLNINFITIAIPTFNYVEFSLPTFNVGNDFALYGVQLEAGSYPTSYIPTVASTVTRNADVISKTGISSLIGVNQGTFCYDIKGYTQTAGIGQPNWCYLEDGSKVLTFYDNGIFTNISGSFQKIANLPNGTIPFKVAYRWNASFISIFVNGIKIVDFAKTSTFNPTYFSPSSGVTNSKQVYNSIIGFNTALTDQECIQLTTL